MPERRSHDYVRHGTTDLFAAFNIADGTVISQLRRHHRAAEFKTFLITGSTRPCPPGWTCTWSATTWPRTRPRPIQAWLARHPRFRLHFTPTGSSWINQVERWFGYLTAQRIRRGVHKSVQALEADIRAWIENWNRNPRPFRWAKTADEILDSLAKYLARISGAGYWRPGCSRNFGRCPTSMPHPLPRAATGKCGDPHDPGRAADGAGNLSSASADQTSRISTARHR